MKECLYEQPTTNDKAVATHSIAGDVSCTGPSDPRGNTGHQSILSQLREKSGNQDCGLRLPRVDFPSSRPDSPISS